uniref:BTB domain-containing protein n=1 Tax=Kalanchoe fedtschenkoi TaxID=63787 RepID=A0A7N0R7Y1_KALFE
MDEKSQKTFFTVKPFECAWRKELRFREAGRGCVAFEAFAHNDVTIVFRENAGSLHYHYKTDNSPHYTVILGSHKNRRLKIEVDGKTMVDVAGIGLCSSSAFQSYWISVYDGLICVGTGRYPFQNLLFRWLDANPNYNVQYVGLSSWDKHVVYRNVNVLPLTQNHMTLWRHVDYVEHKWEEDGEEQIDDRDAGYDKWGLEDFLESWELSDAFFIVGSEERLVPAHRVILEAAGKFLVGSSEEVIHLPGVTYPILHGLLQYIYTGHTQITESGLGLLRDLSMQYEVTPLLKQCDEIIERFKMNKKLFDSGKNVEISYPSSRPHCSITFTSGFPLNAQKLCEWYYTGKYCDVDILVDGYLVAHPHKIILGLCSAPFTKMLTNGMRESISSKICLSDVSPEAVKNMVEFMYKGELSLEDVTDVGGLLLQLLLLADQFGITLLHQECCKTLLECLSEGSACSILQVISPVPSCRLIEETCKRKFSMHFDYCTTANLDFVWLDKAVFRSIIQHPDLTVTSEERVLNAILLWCMEAKELVGWEAVDELLIDSTPEFLFGERLHMVYELLPFVRFPLLPKYLLKKLEQSELCRQMPILSSLVMEALNFLESGSSTPERDQNLRLQHRRSSFRELQYVCDGDSNGVLYFAGTSYGQHQWVNPVLSKKIVITASSPISRYTDPKSLVSRTYQGTSFSGLRIEGGSTCAWWMVDIGEDHQLMCNYYTMRQDGSRTYIRWWNLQGSLDCKNWTDLRVHENDQSLCIPGQFASWPVTGSNSLLPFRYFRVVLTRHTTDTANPWNFCICFLELYGYFR